MHTCSRCKKAFAEKPHLDKQGRPFCEVCYLELMKQRGAGTKSSPKDAERPPTQATGRSKKKIILLSLAIIALIGIGGALLVYLPPQQNDRIVFLRKGEDAGIYTVNPDGTDLERIREPDYMPVGWTEDRTRIIVTRYMDFDKPKIHEKAKYAWATIKADGTDLQEYKASESSLSLSPDGTRRIYEEGRGTIIPIQVYIENVDGSERKQLTTTEPSYGSKSQIRTSSMWTPDGQHILYSVGGPGDWDIYIMEPDGSNPRLFISDADGLQWSPIGDKLLFTARRDGNLEIYVADRNGSNMKNLTNNPAADAYPDWSPDGSEIVFYSDRDGDFEIYITSADGTQLRQITNNEVRDSNPKW